MLWGSNLQTVKAHVCGKSATGRKNVFRITEWSSSQIIRFLLRTEDKEERRSIFLFWGGKIVKGRMGWDWKKWEFISWFCHETSCVTPGNALDTPARLTHVCEMGIISSMINRDFMRTSSMDWVRQGGRAISEGVLWFPFTMGTAKLDKQQARISNSFGVEQCWYPTKSKCFISADKDISFLTV